MLKQADLIVTQGNVASFPLAYLKANNFNVEELLREHYLEVIDRFVDATIAGDEKTKEALYGEYRELWSYFSIAKLTGATAQNMMKGVNIEESQKRSWEKILARIQEDQYN